MGLGAPLRRLENAYLSRYLHGRGLVFYIDRAEISDLKRQYHNVKEQIFLPDVIGDATDLPFAPGTLDFLIASHVLEHLPFPLATLKTWHHALAPGGRLLIKVPDKRYTFDRDRQRTPLAHLVAEYEHPELTDWNAHYADFVENVDHRRPTPQDIIDGGNGLRTGLFNIHFHAWTGEDVLDMLELTKKPWTSTGNTASSGKDTPAAKR
jgi:SAM-dependent methyltransferase